jgi:hypothetical protein
LKFALGALAGALALAAVSVRFSPARKAKMAAPINDQREAREFDETLGGNSSMVDLHPIHLGDLSIPCPLCDSEVDLIQVGMGSVEDRETGEGEFNDVIQIGVVYYLCGHVLYSPCLVNRVALILNAEESGALPPMLFDNLTYCEEHAGQISGDE